MKNNVLAIGILVVFFLMMGINNGWASGLHGTLLWGPGTISAEMGGTGTAFPQDSIMATLRNPAGLSAFDRPVVDFDFTYLRHNSTAERKNPAFLGGPWECDSSERNYPFFAAGIAYPLKNSDLLKGIPISFGFSFGVTSGAGTDWKRNPIGTFSLYEIITLAPCVSYKWHDLSFGAGPRINFGVASLQHAHRVKSGWGYQLGVTYSKPTWSAGVSYISAVKIKYPHILDYDLDGELDPLDMEEPRQVYFGVSYRGLKKWIFNLEGRWINYGDTDLFGDIDWQDIWGVAVGVQYDVLPYLHLRAGYLYNENPVEEHEGYDATGTMTFQGRRVYTALFETWRNAAAPLYCEHHVGFGVGYDILKGVTINLGGTLDFHNGVSYKDSTGNYEINGDLHAYTIEGGLQFRF